MYSINSIKSFKKLSQCSQLRETLAALFNKSFLPKKTERDIKILKKKTFQPSSLAENKSINNL